MKLPALSTKGYTLAGSGPVVLLFHGLTGSPYDLKPLALFLNEQGCEVRVPLLRGHGTKIANLQGVTEGKWLEQVNQEIAKIEKKRPLVLGGLSMGALLAIVSAPLVKTKALLLLSPALRLSISGELAITGVKLGILSSDKSWPKFGGRSDIADPVARKKCPSYGEVPLFGLLQLATLQKKACEQLKEIDVPIFAAFGLLDGAIDIKTSNKMLLKNISSPITSKIYANSKHVLSLDYDRDILAKDVWSFLTLYLR